MDENTEIKDPLKIANAFNNYFTNVGERLATQIPDTNKTPMDYLRSPIKDSYFIKPVESTEIESEISKLKSGKATGPYSIPISILKLIKSTIAEPLSKPF